MGGKTDEVKNLMIFNVKGIMHLRDKIVLILWSTSISVDKSNFYLNDLFFTDQWRLIVEINKQDNSYEHMRINTLIIDNNFNY